MSFDPSFPAEEFTREFVEYRKRYSGAVGLIKNDVLRTLSLKDKAQQQLDSQLGEELHLS